MPEKFVAIICSIFKSPCLGVASFERNCVAGYIVQPATGLRGKTDQREAVLKVLASFRRRLANWSLRVSFFEGFYVNGYSSINTAAGMSLRLFEGIGEFAFWLAIFSAPNSGVTFSSCIPSCGTSS